MRRHVRTVVLLAAGLCAGLPVGYLIRGDSGRSNSHVLGSDELHMTFRKDYFENLPKDSDTESRLLDVVTYQLDTDGDGTPEPESTLTIPLLGLNDLPSPQKAKMLDQRR